MARFTTSPLAVAVATACLAGCSGAGPGAAELAADRTEAMAESHAVDESFTLRLNPAPCDCPEFEILLGTTWVRTFLEPKDPEGPAEATRQALSPSGEGSEPPATVRVAGRLSKSVRMSGNRTPCLVLKVFQVCGRGGCRPGE